MSKSSTEQVNLAPDPPVKVSFELEELSFDDRGLVPVVAQEIKSGSVLMVAWADREAIARTLETGWAHFWSRSRQELWRKGATSGNGLLVTEVRADCDRDTLLYRAHPMGPACHLGSLSCFDRQPCQLELGWLAQVISERTRGGSAGSYTHTLLSKGLERVAQKVGEEAVEVVIASMKAPLSAATRGTDDSPADPDTTPTEPVVSEAADLLYHLLVLFQALDIEPRRVAEELVSRHLSKTASPVAGAVEGKGS